uniref:Uncharacterized protein n=1 Tax=Oryza brachyantha TaxID=4533 RepID=J3LND1_ORYBR
MVCPCSICELSISSKPEKACWRHSVDTFETNSDNSIFAVSRPTEPAFCFASVSCAFSRTDCRYFPCASIRSCRCLCTCSNVIASSLHAR